MLAQGFSVKRTGVRVSTITIEAHANVKLPPFDADQITLPNMGPLEVFEENKLERTLRSYNVFRNVQTMLATIGYVDSELVERRTGKSAS